MNEYPFGIDDDFSVIDLQIIKTNNTSLMREAILLTHPFILINRRSGGLLF
jgi:hypothetical protein